MRAAKTFAYVAVGILALAVAFQMGAQNAQGQAPGNPIVSIAGAGGATPYFLAITDNGDAYLSTNYGQTWSRHGNVFGSAPVQATETTWGRIKAGRR